MNYEDCSKLANYANTMMGRNEATDMQVLAWFDALEGFTAADAKAAVLAHVRDPQRSKFFDVTDILDRLNGSRRMLPHQIEGDVRSAVTRGLIAKDWPLSQPLPADVAQQLADVRASELDAQRALIVEGTGFSRPIDVGWCGKTVPRA